jgi:hypothetical protein
MKQFRKHITLYRYLRKYTANLSLEPLSKATNIREMLAGKNPLQPHQEEFVKWVYDTIPHNDNWRVWLTRHYKQKPEDFTSEIKSKIQHYADMARGTPEIEKVRFDKTHDLHTGLSMLETAEKKYQQKLLDKERKVVPTSITKLFNKAATPNRAWFHLGAGFDAGERKAMGHCATCQSKDAKLLSLRDIVQENGKTYHIPHVTASVYEFPDGSFYIGQMKERFNKRPKRTYHKDIMELLKNPKMVGLVGLGYNPEEDFKFEELTPEQQAEVLRHNPNFIKNDEEAKIKGQEIAEEIKKDITKLKDLTHGHLSLFKNQIQKSLENHPNLLDDPEVVQKLIDSKLSYILAKHPDLFTKFPNLAEKLANGEDWYIRGQIALNPYLLDKAPHLVEKLANDKYRLVRRAISEHPNLFTKFPHLVEKFANDRYSDIRLQIAQHPDLFTKFPHLVEKFANDEDWAVRQQITTHPDLFKKFPNFAEKIANSKYSDVRQEIAKHPDLSIKFPHLIEKLVNDEDWLVREKIAKRPHLFIQFPNLVEKLANDEKGGIRNIIAETHYLLDKFPHLVEKFANDKDSHVRYQIAKHPDLFTKFPHLVEKLANDEDKYVREQIAKHPDLFTKFPHLVEKFANDENKGIRIEISQNPNLFDLPNVAEKLVNDENLDVRLQIAKNPNLFTKAPHLVEKLANDKNFRVRMIIANKPMLGDYPEIAKKLLNDKSSLVRYAAKNSLENKYQKYKQLRFKFRKMKKFEKLTINRYLRLLKYRF